ncbi:FusB/FusC family EF-G-binding protein [Paenibacillus sp. GYB003]|uniref:FusB/FusC family EF-G-binding protein n=1 Tax=Paenibacillus sp. GYB003 TaxID=2994392 RepID=UPI002F9677F7
MNQPFIRNHQYNWIKKQADLLLHACSTVSDPKVVESVRSNAHANVLQAFPHATEEQRKTLEAISELNTAPQFQQYLLGLEPYRTEFAHVTESQLKKLFPKNKKLKIPDLTATDFRQVTYLGWTDIATNKLFIVYELNGQLVGVEGKFTPANKKSVCFVCNRHEEVALFTAIAKTKPANASPDYYKAIGNYLCVNSEACNKNLTDVSALETYIQAVLGS